MPEGTGGGISPDAAFQAIQGQLTQISSQQSSMGAEIGQIRSDTAETKVQAKNDSEAIDELKESVNEISETLHGNGGVGLVPRMAKAEIRIEDVQRAMPQGIDPGRTTTGLPAQNSAWRLLKWQTIKELGNKSYKIAIVVLLIVLGYKELATRVLGVPDAPAPKEVHSAPENPAVN